MVLSELLARDGLGLRVLTGADRVHTPVRWVYTTDLPRPRRFLGGGELVLTGMVWHRGPRDSEVFAAELSGAGVAALAAGTAIGPVPPDLIEACVRHGLVLLEVPADVSFATVTDEAVALLHRDRAAELARHHEEQRRLVVDLAAGAELDAVFRRAAATGGLRAWLLSGTGRLLAAAGRGEDDRPGVTERAELASVALAGATRAEGATVGELALTPVRTRDDHALTGWVLASATAPGEESGRESLAELVSLATLARGRAAERALIDARHAEGLAHLLTARRFDEVATVLRIVSEGRSGPDGQGYAVVCAELDPPAVPPDLARRVLGEVLAARPGTVVTGDADALAVVPLPLPLPLPSAPDVAGEDAARRLRAEVSAAVRVLAAGLGEHRLAVGISALVRALPELRGALVEARHARRLARLRAAPAAVLAGAEIDSHELLLASVPEEVRSSYTERLLGPLVEYDRAHRSELLRTLRRFLELSGSWQRCARDMHLHVNTLRYRIGRVEELTGRDLSRLEHRVDLFLALRLREG